ncbi:hypothetical protein VXN63_00250 [Marinilactibacillus sp. XAAS-LB27]|uniref:hypothetical protein n=1 Tax=Marinilactibacillus sp. XAAS-LB27 TaxID=3114538 RepID=UPI002E198973|nr:hypothetical protein [Marinilactibacillus sp. XAAS-LB27]
MRTIRLLGLSFFIAFLTGCSATNTRDYVEPSSVAYEIEEDTDISDPTAIQEGIAVIKRNLEYAQNENIEQYITTIVNSAQVSTKTELSEFFDLYDMEHTILGIRILEQDANEMLIQVEQQSVAVHTAEEAEPYRDHVSLANHTITKENEQWKIAETVMTETFFIE